MINIATTIKVLYYRFLHALIVLLTLNSSKRKSLRSTIPMSVVKNMGLKSGDNLNWKYEIRNGETVITIRKVKTSNKR
jgi:hypothetical protein